MPYSLRHTTGSQEPSDYRCWLFFPCVLKRWWIEQWWIRWTKLVKGHLGCQTASLSLLSSSRTGAKMNCPSPSTWKSPGWCPKLLEAVKEKYTEVSDTGKHFRARTFPFLFTSCLLHHSQWFQHLPFLTTHGVRNRPRTQQTQKRAAPVQIQQLLLPQSEMEWVYGNDVLHELLLQTRTSLSSDRNGKGSTFPAPSAHNNSSFQGTLAWKLQLSKSVFHKEWHLQTQTPPLPFLGYEQVLGVLARPLLQCSFCL